MNLAQNVVGMMTILYSILVPQKMWYAPSQPINVTVKATSPLTLKLTDFTGKSIDAASSADIDAEKTVDVAALFPAVRQPGTFILWAVPRGAAIADFVGTPLVVEARVDKRNGATPGPMVFRVEPLRYAVMTTDAGPMTMVFYYDVAPNTVDNFLGLAQGGFYDGLTFHRIISGFMIQGGDPRGTGEGGPGYHIDAEFNDHPHLPGVLSMARSNDPNSAAGQFFICLDYNQTRQLDGQYTTFGQVVDGMDAVTKIAQVAVPDHNTGTPTVAPVIQKVEVLPVTPGKNPYAKLLKLPAAAH